MALRKRDLVIAFAAVYGFFVMLLLIEFKKSSLKSPCEMESPCLQFCCKNTTLCNETIIRATVNGTKIDHFDTKQFTILLGKPTCSSLGPLKDSREWSFSFVSLNPLKARIIKNALRQETFWTMRSSTFTLTTNIASKSRSSIKSLLGSLLCVEGNVSITTSLSSLVSSLNPASG